MKQLRLFSLLPLLILVASCSSSQPPAPSTGSLQFAVSTRQALASADISRVIVSSADEPAITLELVPLDGVWGGVIGDIPVGEHRTFLAEAFDSTGALRLQGQASGVSISANQTTAVVLTLKDVAPPPPYGDEVPRIDFLVVSTTAVQAGASLLLTAKVHDPNPGDTIALAWTASAGAFSAPTVTTTSWTAPSSAGAQTLTLSVADSKGLTVSVSLSVNVVSGSTTGNTPANINFNLWPHISAVTSSSDHVDVGQATVLSSIATDADGDSLLFSWSSSCLGTWTTPSSDTTSFTPSSLPVGTCDNCRLSVTVQDGRGGQTTASLSLCVGAPSTTPLPPQVGNYSQSATTVASCETVAFDVTAIDPQSSPVSFTWASTTGNLYFQDDNGFTSRIEWLAPSCVVSSSPGITATVTNSFGLVATHAFAVAGLPSCDNSGWTPTGSMTPRYGHVATLLRNGKVLVSGGGDYSNRLSVELYDPGTGSWTTAGSNRVEHSDSEVALLPDGKVLTVGGTARYSSYLETAEVYDPATDIWNPTGSMSTPRRFHRVTPLPGGKLLVSGGSSHGVFLATAEVYDPSTGTWSPTGSMSAPRGFHEVTPLPDGKILVMGGRTTGGNPVATAEVYDPNRGTWTRTGSMSTTREDHRATLLPTGKVLVAGGISLFSSDASMTAELYDPATGTWSLTGSLSLSRRYHTATLLPNGKVLVIGGESCISAMAAETYDPATGTWSLVGSMFSPRSHHTATLLLNGKVLVTGGSNNNGSFSFLATAELFDPATPPRNSRPPGDALR
ncbi:kelch repeat-containing protein [Cystobacter fuscus]|uniref:Kelch repeat-containing protein n=1 Tax=Cystobacter fuscus TaxID=43 RepID=UPI002B28B0B0|nr:kelch-like protein [Cystobacter fuscus]